MRGTTLGRAPRGWRARRAVGRQARAFAICAAMANGALMVNGGLHQRRKHQGWVLEENIKARFWSTAQGWSWHTLAGPQTCRIASPPT